MFFALGYAQAEDQAPEMWRTYLMAQGRLAEVDGEAALKHDRLFRSFDLRGQAERDLDSLDPRIRAHLIAFCSGANLQIRESRTSLPEWVRPIAILDVIAAFLAIDLHFALPSCERDLASIDASMVRLAGEGRGPESAFAASNQFLIPPSRTSSGGAILSMDPHLPFDGVVRWHEAHASHGAFDVLGAFPVGLPYPAMGRNQHLAWSLTTNGPDLGDVFELELDAADPDRFRGPDGWERIERRAETFRVSIDGRQSARHHDVLRTRFGPVVAVGERKAYAFRVSRPDSLSFLSSIFGLGRAHSVAQLRAAMRGHPFCRANVLAVDETGDALYVSLSRTPIRDLRVGSHAPRPAAEDWADWRGYHPLHELPQWIGPAREVMLNTNSGAPSVLPSPQLQSEDFPPYLIQHSPNLRYRRLRELLTRDRNISLADALSYATDTELAGSAPIISLLSNLGELAAERQDADARTVREVAQALTRWNRRTDTDSRGAVLYVNLMDEPAYQEALNTFQVEGKVDLPLLVRAIVQAAQRTKTEHGSLDVPWGEAVRMTRGSANGPINGHSGPTTTAIRPTRSTYRDGFRIAESSTSFGMIVDWGRNETVSILPFGNSCHPDSPHFDDQMGIYASGGYKPVSLDPSRIQTEARSELLLIYDEPRS